MPQINRLRKIGILGHYGVHNLGDEAIVTAVIQSVRRFLPDAAICCFCLYPDDTQQRHGVPSFPIRQVKGRSASGPARGRSGSIDADRLPISVRERLKRVLRLVPGLLGLARSVRHLLQKVGTMVREPLFLVQSAKHLIDVDLIVVAGSGQLTSLFGGAFFFPFDLLKWTLLAKLTGTRVAFLSMGAGPIETILSRRFIRLALSMADYRSFRDNSARELIERIGVRGSNPVFPDLAFNLRLSYSSKDPGCGGSRVLVGINPIPYYDYRYWPKTDAEKYQTYMRKLVQFSRWLIDEGYSVLFFGTTVNTDGLVVDDINAVLNENSHFSPGSNLRRAQVSSVAEIVACMANCEMIVASRFHGVVIACIMGLPVIGLSYHPKTSDMMTYCGQGEYCLDIEKFDLASIKETFTQLEKNRAAVRTQLGHRTARLRERLEAQYQELFCVQPGGAEAI